MQTTRKECQKYNLPTFTIGTLVGEEKERKRKGRKILYSYRDIHANSICEHPFPDRVVFLQLKGPMSVMA